MVDDDKALRWLDDVIGQPVCFAGERIHARRIREMLGRVMPKEASLDFIRKTFGDWPLVIDTVREYHRALYVDLTAPKTKEVEVWRVEGAVRGADRWIPGCAAYATEAEARRRAIEYELGGWSCIRVTGPHKQTVPV